MSIYSLIYQIFYRSFFMDYLLLPTACFDYFTCWCKLVSLHISLPHIIYPDLHAPFHTLQF